MADSPEANLMRALFDDPHATAFTGGRPTITADDRIVSIELVEFGITIYSHDELKGDGPYLVIDIDNESDDPQPIKIYRNDAPVYDEKPQEATQ